MNTSPLSIILAYILICLLWGTTWLAIKIGLQTVPPFFSAAIRFAVAVSVLALIIKLRKVAVPFTQMSLRMYVMLGIMSFSIPFSLIYWSQMYITSGMGAILFGVYPFLVAIFSSLILKTERMTFFKIGGVCVGFSGLIVLFVNDIRLENEQAMYGACAVIASAVLQSLSLIFLKKHSGNTSHFALNFVGMAIGSSLLFLFSLLFENYSRLELGMPAILSVLYLGVFGSVVTFNAYFWLLKRIDTVLLALSALITPVIAVFAGVLILHESVSLHMALGSSLILFGIFIANWEELRGVIRSRSARQYTSR